MLTCIYLSGLFDISLNVLVWLLSFRISRHTSAALLLHRKRYRRRGKRSGCLVRLRAVFVRPDRGGYGAGPRLCVAQRSLDPPVWLRWRVPMWPSSPAAPALPVSAGAE